MDPVNQWKADAKAGKAAKDARLYKQIPGAVMRAEGGAKSPVTVVLSTAAVDRMGDTIAVEGWKLDTFTRNPVVLFGHDMESPPIGKMQNVRAEGGALVGEIVFASDVYDFAATVEGLVRGGFLNAVSVGFRPIKFAFNEERKSDGWMPPCDFLEQELLELSVVPVPANPEALVEGRSAGDLTPAVDWAERTLAACRGKGMWLPQELVAEKAWKTLCPPATQAPTTRTHSKENAPVELAELLAKMEALVARCEAATAKCEEACAACTAACEKCSGSCDRCTTACDTCTKACEECTSTCNEMTEALTGGMDEAPSAEDMKAAVAATVRALLG